jgi:hypothetical protein
MNLGTDHLVAILMLNNTGDPRQWIYFRNSKKGTLVVSDFTEQLGS